MIRTETLTIGGKQFVRTYSDANRYVVGGAPAGEYTEAIDPAELGRTYIEGNLIPDDDHPADPDTYPAWDIRSTTSFAVGDRVTSDGTVYECIKAHNASWTRQPPNAEYWRTV